MFVTLKTMKKKKKETQRSSTALLYWIYYSIFSVFYSLLDFFTLLVYSVFIIFWSNIQHLIFERFKNKSYRKYHFSFVCIIESQIHLFEQRYSFRICYEMSVNKTKNTNSKKRNDCLCQFGNWDWMIFSTSQYVVPSNTTKKWVFRIR